MRGRQDVEGGKGQTWELRIDSVVQGCFLGSDLRNREGLVLMSLAFSVFLSLVLVFVGYTEIFTILICPLLLPSVCLSAELQGGGLRALSLAGQLPCLTLKWFLDLGPAHVFLLDGAMALCKKSAALRPVGM